MKNKIKPVFCTYFDKNYLPQGLALYRSLLCHHPDAQLWVLCFDDDTYITLSKMKLQAVKLIKLKDFEDKELKEVKPTRKFYEYYWTSTPSLVLHVFKKDQKATHVVYVDADLYFFQSSQVSFDELDSKSILITPHRFKPNQLSREQTSGRFNVGYLIFKRDHQGMACLKRWRQQCLDWCYDYASQGRFGDQLYLNEWPNLYPGLVISQNTGLNAAPWNAASTVPRPLICYHFHQFRIISKRGFDFSPAYRLSQTVIKSVYLPYTKALSRELELVKKTNPKLNLNFAPYPLHKKIKFFFIKIFGGIYWQLK